MSRLLAIGLLLVPWAAHAEDAPRAEWLEAHNRARAAVAMPPLVWDPVLEARAGAWAEQLAKTGRFEHAPQKQDGENLWVGTRGAYPPAEMVGLWVEEKALYKQGRFPDVATNGKWADVGHYTQVIWHSTRRVGCALRSNADDSYLVCRYSPPGNWIGESPMGASPVRARIRRKR